MKQKSKWKQSMSGELDVSAHLLKISKLRVLSIEPDLALQFSA